MARAEDGSAVSYTETLLSRGRMMFELAADGDMLRVVQSTLSEKTVNEITGNVNPSDDEVLKLVWFQAFSGRIPLGWESGERALEDIQASNGAELGTDLVLAGITHPERAVRLAMAVKQALSTKELAVALGFNGDVSAGLIIRLQREHGVTESDVYYAINLLEPVLAGGAIDVAGIMRGDF
jgi:hypothetical protein